MSTLYMKLIGGLVVLLFIGALVVDRNRYKSRATNAEATIASICVATRQASGNAKLHCRDTEKQVAAMGRTLAGHREAIGRINAAVTKLQTFAGQLKQAATDMLAAAEKRRATIGGVRQRYEASARAPLTRSQNCKPSAVVMENWR